MHLNINTQMRTANLCGLPLPGMLAAKLMTCTDAVQSRVMITDLVITGTSLPLHPCQLSTSPTAHTTSCDLPSIIVRHGLMRAHAICQQLLAWSHESTCHVSTITSMVSCENSYYNTVPSAVTASCAPSPCTAASCNMLSAAAECCQRSLLVAAHIDLLYFDHHYHHHPSTTTRGTHTSIPQAETLQPRAHRTQAEAHHPRLTRSTRSGSSSI
mmetsp:Transcript_19388/g.41969  ORF Transcript_19388/g.41969 Transcript_19388/m.41969 type:complete len:213 (+) Transcript_19388:484-1122(+)